MSLQLFSRKLLRVGRLLFQRNISNVKILDHGRNRNIPQSLRASNFAADASLKRQGFFRFGQHARRLFVDNILNRVTNPVSNDLRNQATKKFLYGDSAPFFALIGVSMASGTGILTKDDELEGVCWEIRDAVQRIQNFWSEKELEKQLNNEELGLDLLDIGPPIAKGCSAVVYAAALKNESAVVPEVEIPSDLPVASPAAQTDILSPLPLSRFVHNFGGSLDNLHARSIMSPIGPTLSATSVEALDKEEDENTKKVTPRRVHFDFPEPSTSSRWNIRSRATSESVIHEAEEEDYLHSNDADLFKYPLALKMMFNYDIQSNAMAILKAMYKETLPARQRTNENAGNWEQKIAGQMLQLPAHPNIVLMYGVFCDQIPNLQLSTTLYPMALPQRLNPHGFGRNMSLFLLMKRYHYSLHDYLSIYSADIRQKILLFAQLLEAVVHLNRFGIAHRDIKSDNILIELNPDAPPLLVLSDFGCCIADKRHGLQIPYATEEIDKGGNTALMAPEIITKVPGVFSVLNYGKSDLWATGAIAYEIFNGCNPFYSGGPSTEALKSVDYKDSDLPSLDENVPHIIQKLVENILHRNPSKRLQPEVAANVIQLFLWSPSNWLKAESSLPSNNEVLQWLLSLTTKVLCEGRLNVATSDAKNMFSSNGRRTFTEYIIIANFLMRARLNRIRQALDWIHSIL